MSESAREGHAALDRTAGVAGALTYGMVGLLPVLTGIAMPPVWWVLWAVGIPVFLADVLVELPLRTARWVVPPMVVLGASLYAVQPLYGFGGVPMVITAASAGLLLPLPAGLGVVGLQAAVMLVIGYRVDEGGGLLASVFYVGLQVFALMTGQIARRETLARERLAQVHESLRAAHADLARAHAELEAAQARLAETSRTEERLRISRDLHDLVGHQLSALTLNLEVASHLADGPAIEQVLRSRQLAKDLLADVRKVVSRLREETPDVRTALEHVAALIPRPVVHLDVPEDLAVTSPEVRDALVRSVQEALTNSLRHSGAADAWVSVRQSGTAVEVSVRDDGGGAAVVHPGNGLTGMQERIEAVGGTVRVDGAAGFSVFLTVPVERTGRGRPEPGGPEPGGPEREEVR